MREYSVTASLTSVGVANSFVEKRATLTLASLTADLSDTGGVPDIIRAFNDGAASSHVIPLNSRAFPHTYNEIINYANESFGSIETELATGRSTEFSFKLDFGVGLVFGVGAEFVYRESKTRVTQRGVYMQEASQCLVLQDYESPDLHIDWGEEGKGLRDIFYNSLQGAIPIAKKVFTVVSKVVDKAVDTVVETGKAVYQGGKRLVGKAANFAADGIDKVTMAIWTPLSSLSPFSLERETGFLPRSVTASLIAASGVLPSTEPTTVGDAVLVNAYDNDDEIVPSFSAMELSMGFSEAELKAVGFEIADASFIQIYRWSDLSQTWVSVGGTLDLDEQSVTAMIYDTGTYVLGYKLDEESAELGDPIVWVHLPGEGGRYTQIIPVEWTATDAEQSDGSLAIDIEISGDYGASWRTIASDIVNSGHYEISASSFTPGSWILRITATDSQGNRGFGRSGRFQIASEGFTELTVAPNPVSEGEVAFFYSVPSNTSEALLRVFSISGRELFLTEIDPLDYRWPSSGFWSPVDEYGVPLANGPYLCVVVADERLISQAKMVIQRQ